jgi:hypothetical protein
VPETLYKLQPDRTLHLRGFDHLGAAAAFHSAAPDGFTVSGIFRDAADFAVLVLYDADDFFNHPSFKPLPDYDFTGITLQFDIRVEGAMPLNCRKFPTIDWPFLGIQFPGGGSTRLRLSDYAIPTGDPDLPAGAAFDLTGEEFDIYDRVTIWYQNLAFDYMVPGRVRCTYAFYAGGVGTQHFITAGNRVYGYVEQEGDSSAGIAARLIARVNGIEGGNPPDPEITAGTGENPWEVVLRTRLDTGGRVEVNASGNVSVELHHIGLNTVCAALAEMINGANYAAAQTPFTLAATAEGTRLNIRTVEGGFDANFIRLYAISKNARLRTAQEEVQFSGGASRATPRVRLDFSALGLTSIRSMWLTFAPLLANGRAYQDQEWQAAITNWTVSGPEAVRALRVAGAGSVTLPATGAGVEFTGFWVVEDGFYREGLARVAWAPGAQAVARYYCGQVHDLWLGSLFGGELNGAALVQVDGLPPVEYIPPPGGPTYPARRRVMANLPPGEHTVIVTATAVPFRYDCLEAVVPSATFEAAAPQADLSAALDYSTDHTYKLPPARILWMFDQLGLAGPMNEYIGVFWWNQRRREGGSTPRAVVTFAGQFAAGDAVFLDIGGQVCGKTVFPADTPATIARHFRNFINATYVGVWAESEGADLTIHARSAARAYEYGLEARVDRVPGSTGEVRQTGSLRGGSMGGWVIDASAAEPLNRGARDWHADFFRLAAAGGRTLTTAVSMELVNPPESYAARFPDGQPAITSTGFANLLSTHCAFRGDMLEFQKRLLVQIAGLMSAAGLTPDMQCGEYTWWYFSNRDAGNPGGGMAFYDSDTTAAALATLGRPLHVFTSPDDDPSVNDFADAAFIRSRLRDYTGALIAHVRAAFPGARFEILWPYDVNHPVPSGVHNLGGRLNRYVNLPVEWESKETGPFDRFKVEGLDFGVWSRNLDLSRKMLSLPLRTGWRPEDTQAMVPLFRGASLWRAETAYARELGLAAVCYWAFDHICLFGWDARPRARSRSGFQG